MAFLLWLILAAVPVAIITQCYRNMPGWIKRFLIPLICSSATFVPLEEFAAPKGLWLLRLSSNVEFLMNRT